MAKGLVEISNGKEDFSKDCINSGIIRFFCNFHFA